MSRASDSSTQGLKRKSHGTSAVEPKRKKVSCSAQLMDILGYEQPILSGEIYEPGREATYPLPVEVSGWDFVLENVDLPAADFESKLENMIHMTENIRKLPDELRNNFQKEVLQINKKAKSCLEGTASKYGVGVNGNGLRHRKPSAGDNKTASSSMRGGSKGSSTGSNEAKVDAEIVLEFGGPKGTLAIMIISHVLMYYLWLALEQYDGSLFIPRIRDLKKIYDDCFPTREIALVYLVFIVFQALLGWGLPGFHMKGLPIPSEGYTTLDYNCNALGAWWLTLAAILCMHYCDIFDLSYLADNYGRLMTVMVIFGDTMAIAIYVSGFLLKRTHRMSGNHIYDFFMGSWLNPRIGNFDLKMWAEVRVSWFTLFLLTLSCFLKNLKERNGDFSSVHPGLYVLLVAHWLYTNACVKGEECIVTTWDIFYEKWGWMLIFWNFAGVPIVYTWNSFYILKKQPFLPPRCGFYLIICLLITYYIWDTTNSQKNRFRMQLKGTFKQRPWYVFPQLPWGTLDKPIAIRTHNGSRLLVSGWYGLSGTRKLHYLMDILFALEWGLAAGMENFLPYFYLFFFSTFILHRGIRDNERCQKKYGKDWDRYCKMVPYILVPGIW